jgi:hypothetical protein
MVRDMRVLSGFGSERRPDVRRRFPTAAGVRRGVGDSGDSR